MRTHPIWCSYQVGITTTLQVNSTFQMKKFVQITCSKQQFLGLLLSQSSPIASDFCLYVIP